MWHRVYKYEGVDWWVSYKGAKAIGEEHRNENEILGRTEDDQEFLSDTFLTRDDWEKQLVKLELYAERIEEELD